MKLKTILTGGLLGICITMPMIGNAKVSEQVAQSLKKELSPIGAEIAGNAEGSIPAWTGSMRGIPEGSSFKKSGDVYPDPYKDDKVLFTITASNMDKYADKLSEGQKALLKKYPSTYKIPVYPTHRDGRYSEIVEQRTWYCATNTELANGIDNLVNFTGGAPFPIPANGAEAIWNTRVIHPHPTQSSLQDDFAVYPNGTRSVRRQRLFADYTFANPDNKVGQIDDEISKYAAYVLTTVEKPAREKGKMVIVHEALDQMKYSRNAWIYLPGSRRVRRAPTVGYDTPDGPGGLLTVDDTLGFNGALDRYEWNLVGKKEIYVPFHAYKFDDPNATYDQMLTPGHVNPDFMRYELHRVWVVEATLKDGARHVYGKRRFYIEEDSWQIVLIDSYDGRGELWRVGLLNTLYAFGITGFVGRTEMFHDLQAGAYVIIRMNNETAPTVYDGPQRGAKYYTPQNLRKLGRR